MPAVPSINSKPLYALAGAGEAAVTALRTRVVALPALVQVLPAQVKELRTQVSQQVVDLAGKAEQAYDAFAAQGEKTVAARRGETAASTQPAAKPAPKPAAKPAAKRVTKTATKPAVPTTTAGLPETPVATSETSADATQQTLNGTATV